MTKVCSKCKVDQSVDQFCVDRKRKDGKHPQCKKCRSLEYQANKSAILANRKAYYQANQEKVKQTVSAYRKNNKEVIRLKERERNKARAEERKAYNRNYRQKNIKDIREKGAAFYQKNKETISKTRMPYYLKWSREKRKSDPLFAMSGRVRAKINKALRSTGSRKSKGTQEYVGCTWKELAIHIERQFTPNMNWDNRDQWHIDHIVPVASAKTVDDLIPLLHFTNLRPLWAHENQKKAGKRLLLI